MVLAGSRDVLGGIESGILEVIGKNLFIARLCWRTFMAETIKKTKAPSKPKKAVAKKTEAPTGIAIVKPVSQQEVAMLAHRFWAERGYQHGRHVDDWFRAEQALRGKAS